MSDRPLLLAYHAVGAWSPALAIPEHALRAQLTLLQRRGYVGLTAAEAERRRQDGTLPARTVVVTFDDGFRSVLRARPILEELGFPATVFVVTSFVESGEPLQWPGLEQSEESLGWHPEDSLLIPLEGREGRILASISVDDPVDRKRPTTDSLRILELFAAAAGATIEEDRLHTQLVRSERLKALGEMAGSDVSDMGGGVTPRSAHAAMRINAATP